MLANELIKNPPNIKDRASGIYMILCVSGRAYIGQSKNMRNRWSAHRGDLKHGKHKNCFLQNSYNKYGKDSLRFFVLENCIENMAEREAYWLNLLDEDLRLNLAKVTEVIPTSEATKQKIAKISSGRKHTEEAKRKISEANKGHKYGVGQKRSEESRKRQSEAQKNYHRLNPDSYKGRGKGLKRSAETRLNMSLARKGRKLSDETKKKLSENMKRIRQEKKW